MSRLDRKPVGGPVFSSPFAAMSGIWEPRMLSSSSSVSSQPYLGGSYFCPWGHYHQRVTGKNNQKNLSSVLCSFYLECIWKNVWIIWIVFRFMFGLYGWFLNTCLLFIRGTFSGEHYIQHLFISYLDNMWLFGLCSSNLQIWYCSAWHPHV